jgi:S-formylglutathione hydrolase FrmB
MRYRVLLPENYGLSLRRYPVLVPAARPDGDYRDWTTRSNVAEYSRTLPLIIVMPDGENSVVHELGRGASARSRTTSSTTCIQDVEKKYDVIRSSYGRAIAGLSMGGSARSSWR